MIPVIDKIIRNLLDYDKLLGIPKARVGIYKRALNQYPGVNLS